MSIYAFDFVLALVSALACTAATVAVEKLGGTAGGIISTVPVNTFIASIGIALNNVDTPEVFRRKMFQMPAAICVTIAFQYSIRYFALTLPIERSMMKLLATMSGAFFVWFVGVLALSIALPLAIGAFGVILPSALLYAIFMSFATYIAFFCPIDGAMLPLQSKWFHLPLRGLSAATILLLALYFSRINDVVGNAFTMFPVIMLVATVSLWIAHGQEVVVSYIAPLLVGMNTQAICSILLGLTMPPWGILASGIFSWFSSVIFVAIPIYFALRYFHAKRQMSQELPPMLNEDLILLKETSLAEEIELDSKEDLTESTPLLPTSTPKSY